VAVESEKGGTTTIIAAIPANALNITSNMGKPNFQLKIQKNKSYITINTKVGEIITIRDKNFPTEIISPVKSSSYNTEWWGLQKNHKESILKKNRN
jgi:hypothetical protein